MCEVFRVKAASIRRYRDLIHNILDHPTVQGPI
jgi:hypothetical protein